MQSGAAEERTECVSEGSREEQDGAMREQAAEGEAGLGAGERLGSGEALEHAE